MVACGTPRVRNTYTTEFCTGPRGGDTQIIFRRDLPYLLSCLYYLWTPLSFCRSIAVAHLLTGMGGRAPRLCLLTQAQ